MELTRLAFESSGKIDRIDIGLGEAFSKGQPLAALDDTNYRLQLQQAKAAYATAVANRDRARKEVKRLKKLVAAKAVPEIQLDNFRLQLRTAQEAINNAQAQIALAEKQRKDTVLVAPFDGVINAQLGEVGQLAGPQVPVFVVEAQQTPEISLAVPENMIARIALQQPVTVRFSAQPQLAAITAQVAEIAPQAKFGAFLVKLHLPELPTAIKPGMTAEVLIAEPSPSGSFAIPPSALGADPDDKHFVYRIVDDSANSDQQLLEKVFVSVETLSNNSMVIKGALSGDDLIVRSGWSFLRPEQRVSLMGEGDRIVNP